MSDTAKLIAQARRATIGGIDKSLAWKLADALEAAEAENARLTEERDLAYQDAGAASQIAGAVFEDERRGWDVEREALRAEIARLQEALDRYEEPYIRADEGDQ